MFGRERQCHAPLLSHWKLKKSVCYSCSVWRNKLLCELWNLTRLLSYHFVKLGFPRFLLPIFSNPVSPFTFNLLTSERGCVRLELPITQLPANKISNFWVLPDLVSVQMVTQDSLQPLVYVHNIFKNLYFWNLFLIKCGWGSEVNSR